MCFFLVVSDGRKKEHHHFLFFLEGVPQTKTHPNVGENPNGLGLLQIDSGDAWKSIWTSTDCRARNTNWSQPESFESKKATE